MRRRHTPTAVCATIIASALVLAPAAAATGDVASEGFWYFDVFNIQAAHDAGLTGEGVTIAVIDTQLNLEVPTLQGADIEVTDPSCYDENGDVISPTSTDLGAVHGTNIVSYLVGSGEGYPGQTGVKGIVPDARIIYTNNGTLGPDGQFVCGNEDFTDDGNGIADGIRAAIAGDADIISLSLGKQPSEADTAALAEALNAGIVVVGSVANSIGRQGGEFPSGMNGVVGVQSLASTGEVQGTGDGSFESHTDARTDVAGPGSGIVWQGDGTWEQQKLARGTSLATPIVAGFLALVAQKYPEATGNQLIQSLIHNTGVDDHPLEYDESMLYGFGTASATHMLRVDPSQYEDVNPLLTDDPAVRPTLDEIAAATPGDTDPTSAPTEQPGDQQEGAPVGLIIGIAAGLVVVAVVILILVMRSRRNRSTPTPPAGAGY